MTRTEDDTRLVRAGLAGILAFTLGMLLVTHLIPAQRAEAYTNSDYIYGYMDDLQDGIWQKYNPVTARVAYTAYNAYAVADFVTFTVDPGKYNAGSYWCEYRLTDAAGNRLVVQRVSGSWTEGVTVRRELDTANRWYTNNPRVYCDIYHPMTAYVDPDFTGTMYLNPSK